MIERQTMCNALILLGSLFVFVHTLESSKTMNLTITNNAPKHALLHDGHDRPGSLLQQCGGAPLKVQGPEIINQQTGSGLHPQYTINISHKEN